MITRKDLIEAIEKCQGQKNPNANTCIKLAAYYTILDHTPEDDSGYSFSGPSSEFSSTPGFHATMIFTGSSGAISCRQLSCSGTKKRIVKTEDYGTRSLYCYETPTPMFGDIGEGKIAEDGKCYIWLDSTFSETIKTESYQVFLQKYGQGECYVSERNKRYFVVEGTEGIVFGWEIKARQRDYENERLENFIEPEIPKDTIDYAEEAIKHFNALRDERMVA